MSNLEGLSNKVQAALQGGKNTILPFSLLRSVKKKSHDFPIYKGGYIPTDSRI